MESNKWNLHAYTPHTANILLYFLDGCHDVEESNKKKSRKFAKEGGKKAFF